MPASSAFSGAESLRARRATLTLPVDIASLGAFRILFGLLMATAMVRFLAKGWVRELYVEPEFHFSYPGFEWVQPWPGLLMHAHFVALAVLAIGIALGLFYRVCIVLFFLGFTYVELLDQTTYLNHYYLISLLSGLMIFLPAHRAWSLDAWRRPSLRVDAVPAWCLNILRFQIALVYLFAGLAKLNADWLFRAQPLRIWLAARGDLPLVGHWLEQTWVAYGASWFGAAFDCSIAFFLLLSRTRKPAFAVLILFHIATWFLFNIGMFPWIMIVAATLLLPADWPRHATAVLRTVTAKAREYRFLNGINARQFSAESPQFKPASPLLRCALCLYILVQLALPLRPYFMSQPAAWSCSGFNCAWQVMIVEKTGYAEFYAMNPTTGERSRLPLKNYITPRQEIMMAQDPYLIRAMAHHLADDINARAGQPVQIYVTAFASLNGRPSQLLIAPKANLADEVPPDWIIPLTDKPQTQRGFPSLPGAIRATIGTRMANKR